MPCLALLLTRCGIHSNCQQKLFHWWSLHCGRVLHICLGSATALSQRVNPFRGKPTYMSPRLKGIPTYMSPKVKGYTDIYPNLYGYRDTCHLGYLYQKSTFSGKG